MKKKVIRALFISLILTFSACGQKPADEIIDEIPKEPQVDVTIAEDKTSFEYIEDGKTYSVVDKTSIEIPFELTEAGYFKFLAYDASDYEEYTDAYWDNMPRFELTFYDQNNTAIYESIDITEGTEESYYFDVGTVEAVITFQGEVAKMTDVFVSWVFAPEREEPVILHVNEKAAAIGGEDHIAEFAIHIDQDGLYKIYSSEACMFDMDTYFIIHDAEGNAMTGELLVHETEWGSRRAFLPEGDYTIAVQDYISMATCKVELEETYANIIKEEFTNLSLPATLGFTPSTLTTVEIPVNLDGSMTELEIDFIGSNTYYDSEQYFDIYIKDVSGNVIYEEVDVEGRGFWDMSEYQGDFILEVVPQESGVMNIILKNLP